LAETERKRISHRGWLGLLGWTIGGTLFCLTISLIVVYLTFRHLDDEAFRQAMINSALLPIVLAAPLFFYMRLKLRELAIVNHKLVIAASTDGLTACLNRRAFSDQVYARLMPPDPARRVAEGALLMIDADHFKLINDRFGHDQGDEALRIIARSIGTAVRRGDLVGRLGGEEFGVFLPDASRENVADIAERIRRAIADAEFLPNGIEHRLSVSVGGAIFDGFADFDELSRVADQRLYQAKTRGRNRVELTPVPAFRLNVAYARLLH